MRYDRSFGSRTFDMANYLFMALFTFAIVYPIYYMLIVSISRGDAVVAGRVRFLPIGVNFRAYQLIMKDPSIIRSYTNTILYTSVGTALNMVLTVLCAFPLSRRYFFKGDVFMMMIAVTMFFSGGLIPLYLVVLNLRMIDTIWAVVIPGAISAWNMIIMRTFFQGIPEELFDSARIDGANDMVILLRIVLPTSITILVTIAMFYAVGHWNAWFHAVIFLNSKKLYPVQITLRNIVIAGDMRDQTDLIAQEGPFSSVPGQNIKYAVTMFVITPILFIYPFAQKYFIKGVMIGSLKG